MPGLAKFLAWPLIGLVHVYRWVIRPFLPPACRFYPSCSEYALQALHRHGPFWGALLSAKRLLSCHPFHPGGLDPVPEKATLASLWKRHG